MRINLRNLSLWNAYTQKFEFLQKARARITFLVAVFALLYGLIMVRLVQIYVYHRYTTNSYAREAFCRPMRADILDRNGQIMATDIVSYRMYADPVMILDAKDLVQQLSSFCPGISSKMKELQSDKRYIKLKDNLSLQDKKIIESLGIPGVYFKKELTRVYTHGPVGSHILGFCNDEGMGIYGIEKYFNHKLVQDTAPVQLSIDVCVQEQVRTILEKGIQKYHAAGGNALIMDQYGEIIAAVSLPDFVGDCNDPSKIHHALNRNFQGCFEPGSSLKIINVAIALDTKTASFNSQYDARHPYWIGRFPVKDFTPQLRIISLVEAFVHSSNIASIMIQDRFGGPKVQRAYFEKLGLLEKTEVEVPETAATSYPTVWNETRAKVMSYGYGISVAPITLLRAVATVVNDGIPIQPTLLKQSEERLRMLRKRYKTCKRVISPEASKMVRKLMRMVMTDGTGRRANLEGVYCIGKTGTAQKMGKNGRYDANNRNTFFVCSIFTPKKRYFMLFMLDSPKAVEGTYGFATAGWNIVPIGREILEAIAPHLGISAQPGAGE